MARGGKRIGAGRPKITDSSKRNIQIAFKVTQDEKQRILEQAQRENLTISKYLVKTILQ